MFIKKHKGHKDLHRNPIPKKSPALKGTPFIRGKETSGAVTPPEGLIK
jgi:hypothetical protein